MNYWNFRKYPHFLIQNMDLYIHLHFQMSNCSKPPLQEKPTDKEKLKEGHMVFSLKVSQAAKTSVFWRLWISRVHNDLWNQPLLLNKMAVSACHGALVELFQQLQQKLCHAVHIRWQVPCCRCHPPECHERIMPAFLWIPVWQTWVQGWKIFTTLCRK